MWRVLVKRSAKKDLVKIDSRYQRRLVAAIYFIGQDPYVGKKLEDNKGDRYSMRMSVYRIVYRVNKPDRLVTIVRIGHRQSVYKY